MSSDKKTILAFMKTQPMATISTIGLNSQQPESALIAFAETDDLEIIFETFVDTRKCHNLQVNPRIALVAGWDTQNHLTLQYEGEALPIAEDQIKTYRDIFLAKDTPCTETFLLDPRVRLFKVRPTWIRYSDYTQTEPRVIELDFPPQT